MCRVGEWACESVCVGMWCVAVRVCWVCVVYGAEERENISCVTGLNFEITGEPKPTNSNEEFLFSLTQERFYSSGRNSPKNLPLGRHGPAPGKRFQPQRIWQKGMSK